MGDYCQSYFENVPRMHLQHCLTDAILRLSLLVELPSLEAQILMAYAIRKPRTFLHAHPDYALTTQEYALFSALILRRLQKEPIAYLIRQREFWSLNLTVNTDTLIPRPETELLVEWILEHITKKQLRVADLGTGSGAIALALARERPNWNIFGIDKSPAALQIASENATKLAINNVRFCCSEWLSSYQPRFFDLIVSNPPYLSETEWLALKESLLFEPHAALVAGPSGLEAIAIIADQAKNYLNSGGYLVIEHGCTQQNKVVSIFKNLGYQEVQSLSDLSHHPRVVIGQVV